MEYSTLEPWQEESATGVVYSLGSLYDHFQRLGDPRKAKGKLYNLVTLLVLIFLAKLCEKERPVEIADWAKNQAEELTQLLGLQRIWMPHHNTYRRVFRNVISEEEFERLMEEYNRSDTDESGETLAMDGKALRGTSQWRTLW